MTLTSCHAFHRSSVDAVGCAAADRSSRSSLCNCRCAPLRIIGLTAEKNSPPADVCGSKQVVLDSSGLKIHIRGVRQGVCRFLPLVRGGAQPWQQHSQKAAAQPVLLHHPKLPDCAFYVDIQDRVGCIMLAYIAAIGWHPLDAVMYSDAAADGHRLGDLAQDRQGYDGPICCMFQQIR